MRRRRQIELRDPLTYTSVTEWYDAYQGRVPIQMAAGLDTYVREHGCTFAEAWTALRESGAIILVEYDEAPVDETR